KERTVAGRPRTIQQGAIAHVQRVHTTWRRGARIDDEASTYLSSLCREKLSIQSEKLLCARFDRIRATGNRIASHSDEPFVLVNLETANRSTPSTLWDRTQGEDMQPTAAWREFSV